MTENTDIATKIEKEWSNIPSSEKIIENNYFYRFKTINAGQYKLLIVMTTKDRTINFVIKNASKALFKQKEIMKKYKETKFFEIPKSYYSTLKLALGKQIKEIDSIISKKGRNIINYNISNIFFKKSDTVNNLWDIYFLVNGDYKIKC